MKISSIVFFEGIENLFSPVKNLFTDLGGSYLLLMKRWDS